MKKFTYTKITGQYYLDYTDEWEEDGIEFDYDVEEDDLADAIVQLLQEDGYFEDVEIDDLKEFILNFDLVDKLADEYESELKEMFEKEAFDSYEEI